MSTAPEYPEHSRPWSMPARFLPVPKEYSCANNSTRIDLRSKTLSQLRALAAKHNSRNGIAGDPFHSTLKGIPERAKLRPDSKVATTDTIGSMLPADSPYAKAWRSVKRQAKQGKGADAAAKRAEAAKQASRSAKVAGKAAVDPAARAAQRQSQQLVIPAEQTRWRSKLSAFLGRTVDVPQLAPAAPVLDMNKLFIEVMNQGGFDAVTAADGWPGISFQVQRDAELAEKVQAVYDCYLLPLEQDLPPGFRPARNIDHLDSRIQHRAAMGCRVPTFEAVAYAVTTATAAIQQVLPWAGEPSRTGKDDMQQQEQQQLMQQAEAQAQQKECLKMPSQLVHAALLLLRQAAVHPDALAQHLLQNTMLAQLHRPSQDACIAQYRRVHASRRQSQGGSEQDERDAVKMDILGDIAAVKAATATVVASDNGQAEIRSLSQRSTPDGLAVVDIGTCIVVEQQSDEPDKPVAEQPAPKRRRESPARDECQLQESKQCPPLAAVLQQRNAARWLLLSRRAIASGPPGCDRSALEIPGLQRTQSSAGRSKEDESGVQQNTGVAGAVKKAFHGITPKCGQCRTCLNPNFKKPCITNKARLERGLAPLLPNRSA